MTINRLLGFACLCGLAAACGTEAPTHPDGAGGSGDAAAAGTPSSGGAGANAGTSPANLAGTTPVGDGGNASAGGSQGGSGNAGAPSAGSGGGANACVTPVWPSAAGEKAVPDTIDVTDEYDGKLMRHNGQGEDLGIDCSGADEQSSTQPLFNLKDGATIKNVIFGKFAADGIHCEGSCTIENVWWEDLCDDAATFLGDSANMRATITGGGARHGADKTFQHNGAGTVVIKNFYVEDVGKLYRSCGTCEPQYARHVELSGITARDVHVQLVGMNEDFDDSAKLSPPLCVHNVHALCGIYSGNVHQRDVADGKTCIYDPKDAKLY